MFTARTEALPRNARLLRRWPRASRTRVTAGLRLSALAGVVLALGCGDAPDAGERVSAQSAALRNTGRTPEQKSCDDKWQACYIDCSVRYPESNDALDEDRRQGCFDSCDASHNLCAPARAVGGAATQGGAVLDGTSNTVGAPTASVDTAAVASRAAAALKSCTLSSDGGLWCCEPIASPPYVKCTYTPPPDTIWTFTSQAALAP